MGGARQNPPQRLAPPAAGGLCQGDAIVDRPQGDRSRGAGDAVRWRRVGKAASSRRAHHLHLASVTVGTPPPSLFLLRSSSFGGQVELRRTLCHRTISISGHAVSSSCPAKAGHPVGRGFSIQSLAPVFTGSPAFAGDDGWGNVTPSASLILPLVPPREIIRHVAGHLVLEHRRALFQ